MHNLPRIISAFVGQPWAIMPVTLATMRMVLSRWAEGTRLTPDEIQAAVGDAPQAAAERRERSTSGPGSVAVIPVLGIISQRMALVDDISGPGGTSTERLENQINAAMADDTVGAIVLDVDSPGGGVYGVAEVANRIRAARESKRVVAVVNSLCASAAFWIASACDEIVITEGGEMGSVGVYGAHEDISKYLEDLGVKVTLISAGKYKVEGNPYEPLGEDALAFQKQRVDEYAAMFHQALAKGRNVSVATARTTFGEGRTFGAQESVDRGMADRIGTLAETIDRLGRSTQAQKPRGRSRADAERRLRLAQA